MAVCQSFRMTGIKREQAQQFREYFPAVRHHKILAGDEQVQTGCISTRPPDARRDAGRQCGSRGEACRLRRFPSRSGSPGRSGARAVALSVVQSSPRRTRGNMVFSRGRVKICQDRVWNLRKFKAAALQRAQQVLGIHLIHNRTQICEESVKFFHQVISRQAEYPLQIVPVHRAVVSSLPGQQVAGDVEQGVQGRECCQPVLAADKGLPGIG